MKYYACLQKELPRNLIVEVFGAVEEDGGVYYTQPFDSKNHVNTLIGTLQSRAEQQGLDFYGGLILPYGTKNPSKRGSFKVQGPLKSRMDYGVSEEPKIWEMRSVYNRFYASKKVDPDQVLISSNAYYPNGVRAIDVQHYFKFASQFILNNCAPRGFAVTSTDTNWFFKHREELNTVLSSNHVVEVGHAVGQDTKQLTVRIVASRDGWKDAKIAACLIELGMKMVDTVDILETQISFSGDNGFDVTANFMYPIHIDEAQKIERAVISYVRQGFDSKELEYRVSTPDSQITSLYSIHAKTGLVKIPVKARYLPRFEKNMAVISNTYLDLNCLVEAEIPTEYQPSMQEQEAMNTFIEGGKRLTEWDIKHVLYFYHRVPFAVFMEVANNVGGWMSGRGLDPQAVEEDVRRLIEGTYIVKFSGIQSYQRFLISPDGELTVWDDFKFHDEKLEELGFGQTSIEVQREIVEMALHEGWCRGAYIVSDRGKELTFDVGTGKTTEWVLNILPIDFYLPTMLVVVDDNGPHVVPLDPGEDIVSAWGKRNQKSQQRMYAAEEDKFVAIPFGDMYNVVPPALETMPKSTIDFIIDLPGKVSPTDIQRMIRAMLGFEVPLDKIGEFISLLKLTGTPMKKGQG